MPTDPVNPGRPRPDESDLLAFIEGERLPRDREMAVAKTLEADPALARRLEQMRRDRLALRSLPEVSAPPGLMDAVEAALQPMLERRMLLGLRDGDPLDSRPPVSLVQPARRSVLATIFAERAGRYSALAAGLLLLVGGAAYWAATSLWPSTSPGSVTVADTRDTAHDSPAFAKSSTDGARIAQHREAAPSSDPNPPATLVDRSEKAEDPSAKTVADAASGAPTIEATMVGADSVTVASGISNERAIQLASEHRLVIRLIAPDPVVLAQPDRVAEQIRRAQSPAWRLGDAAPAELASMLNAAPVSPPAESHIQRPDRSVATNEPAFEVPEFEGPPAPDIGWTASASTVYLVQTRLDGAAIDSLRNSLAPYGEPVLEEATSPLPIDGASPNPAAVIWWSQPPAGWTSWASIPVVIDQAR